MARSQQVLAASLRTSSALMSLLQVTPVLLLLVGSAGGLQVGYYDTSCPIAEAIVQIAVARYHFTDPFYAAGILRMHFHDCWVRVSNFILISRISRFLLKNVYIYAGMLLTAGLELFRQPAAWNKPESIYNVGIINADRVLINMGWTAGMWCFCTSGWTRQRANRTCKQ